MPLSTIAEHIRIAVLNELQDAEEIGGTAGVDDYLALMLALRAEIDRRIATARGFADQASVAAATLGARGGSATSRAKRAAARANGAKGGRPRKRRD